MPKTYEVYLTVREADEADFDKPLVRIHQTDKPRDIKWGDFINISMDKKHWVTCRLEPPVSLRALLFLLLLPM